MESNELSPIPPRPSVRGRPPSVRSIKKAASRTDTNSLTVDRRSTGLRCPSPGVTPKNRPISVCAGFELTEADAQAYRARINEQRRLVRERRKVEEEELARRYVDSFSLPT